MEKINLCRNNLDAYTQILAQQCTKSWIGHSIIFPRQKMDFILLLVGTIVRKGTLKSKLYAQY